MKPIAADTLSGMPVTQQREDAADQRERHVEQDQQRACRTDPNALNSRTKIRRMLTGTITASRAIARCWFSNSPPQTIAYPGGSCDVLRDPLLHVRDDAAHVAAADEHADRHDTRCPFSRLMFIAPLAVANVGDLGQRNVRAVGRVDEDLLAAVDVARVPPAQPHDDAEWRSPSQISVAGLPPSAVSMTSWMSATFRP